MGSLQPPPPSPSFNPPPPSPIISLRTSRMMPLGGLSITSGINKLPRTGLIPLSKVGLDADEHDLTFHGGPDKAIHQYCANHYSFWQEQFTDAEVKKRFVPGGFGENLVVGGEWSEKTVCIGDVVWIGWPGQHIDNELNGEEGQVGALLEVSIPRQPCYKLNQRFGVKNFAPRTHKESKTGWYYRVLRPGAIEVGMEIRVMERRHPRWTIERCHYFIHRVKDDWSINEEAVQIPQMGNEAKRVFEGRITKRKEEAEGGTKKKASEEVWVPYKITEKYLETPRVVAITLEAVEPPKKVASIEEGSHARLKLPNALIRAYSIVGGTNERFQLGISRDEKSRGGSVFLHDKTKTGDVIDVGKITESVPQVGAASNHLFIVGGIGITAYLAIIEALNGINYNFELHYAVKSQEEVAFRKRLEKLGKGVTIYESLKGERMNVKNVLENRKWNSFIYVCGPERLIEDVQVRAKELGIPESEVHYEAFVVDTGGDPFTVDVEGLADEVPSAKEGAIRGLKVGEEETLLQVLRKAGLEVGSSCEVGNCGTCRVGVRKGKIDHRGSGLPEDEKAGFGDGKDMLSCVSRGIGHIVVELPDEE